MSKKKFNRGDAEEEEGASWVDSYADLVTDLMAVFVVLFSFAMMNQAFAASKSSPTPDSAVLDISVSQGASQESSIFSGRDGVLENHLGFLPDQ